MKRNKQFILASIIIFLATATCQTSGNPISTPVVEQIQTAIILTTVQPTSTVSAGNSIHTIFPSFSLTDPNAVCVAHYYYALSCVDSSGWHVYENEYDETTHPTSTIPNKVFGCPDGRIYLVGDTIYRVEGETLTDIGGYVDLGTLACGRGNEIWVSDFSEVKRFDGSAWISYPMEEYINNSDGSPSDIYFLGVAPNGNVWVTTDNAIATFDGSEWKTLTLLGNYYFMQSGLGRQGLTIDSSGVVWVVAYPETCCVDSQLLRFDGVEWSAFPRPSDDYYDEMNIIAADHENRIWVSTHGNKIFTLNPETKEWDFRFDVSQLGLGIGNESAINDMKFDGQGRLWVTTNYGLGIYDGVTWTTYHVRTANLYTNNSTGLSISGEGPKLPAPEVKLPGSVRGRVVSQTQSPFTDALVEICETDFLTTRCTDQIYHAFEKVNEDGSFSFSNVPVGTYVLYLKISNERYRLEMVGTRHLYICTVKEGEETQLGDIIIVKE
jgi:hypothetical protein